ncbi:hypothetical protein BH11VER1_BH11VER1_10660 [soil metagenome]
MRWTNNITIFMRLLTAVKLLVTQPSMFVQKCRDLIALASIRRQLKGKLSQAPPPIWSQFGSNEFPFFGDGDEQEIHYHYHFDEWYRSTEKLFRRYINVNSVTLDVGANLGFITLVMSRIVGENGAVHSFEPGAGMYKKLSALVERNHLNNVTLHPYGCGSSDSTHTLTIPQASGNATLRDTFDKNTTSIVRETVSVKSLDLLLGDQLDRLDFIKIDTEGFESEVLIGADKLITKFRPIIYIELCSDYRDSSASAIAFLRSKGYRFPVEPDLNSSRNGENYFAIPV